MTSHLQSGNWDDVTPSEWQLAVENLVEILFYGNLGNMCLKSAWDSEADFWESWACREYCFCVCEYGGSDIIEEICREKLFWKFVEKSKSVWRREKRMKRRKNEIYVRKDKFISGKSHRFHKYMRTMHFIWKEHVF